MKLPGIVSCLIRFTPFHLAEISDSNGLSVHVSASLKIYLIFDHCNCKLHRLLTNDTGRYLIQCIVPSKLLKCVVITFLLALLPLSFS